MTELDPYAVLGVPRAATREEIARAFRRLAKQHHPDSGAPMTQKQMVRINEAWHVLSDAARRARWDRLHPVVPGPPPWAAAYAEPVFRRPPRAEAVPSRMDSGWVVAGIVALVVGMVAVVMIGVTLASQPVDDRLRFQADDLTFLYPPEWRLAPGDGTDAAEHRVLAHLVTFVIRSDEECTSFASPCPLTVDTVPPGEASIVITAWEGGTPPVPNPLVTRPFGLDADAIIGGEPAAVGLEESRDGVSAWWQLSPPGFPDRWIEIRADVGGQPFDREDVLAQIDAMLESVEFES